MDKVIADEKLLAKVRTASDPFDLCDASGAPVAVVVSADLFRELFLAWSESQLTHEMIEENRRAVADGRVLTTAQVLERLASLERIHSGGA